MRHLAFALVPLLLAACEATPPAPSVPDAAHYAFHCSDGRTLDASYPDTDTAVLVFDGQTHHLDIAISASGARYIGPGWQWWTKGQHEGWLAPLATDETTASAPGVECKAQEAGGNVLSGSR